MPYPVSKTADGTSQNVFSNVAVPTQATIVADGVSDTLTVAAGTGITLTTDATTDTLTIAAAGGGGAPATTEIMLTAAEAIAKVALVAAVLPDAAYNAITASSPGYTVGFAKAAATSPNPVTVVTSGLITATTAEWDAITGGTGGLVAGAYYADNALNGKITQTLATTEGSYIQQVGTAINSTTMCVGIGQPHKLDYAPRAAEYITASASDDLSAERVLTNTATVTWDFATAGQAKADIANLAVTTAKLADAAITQAQLKTKAAVALADAAATLTAAQLVDSGIFTITPTIARILTTDTAANIVAAIPRYQVGTWFDIVVVNNAAFDVTLAAGTGVTLSGKAVINNVSGTWRARIDSSTAVTIYRM